MSKSKTQTFGPNTLDARVRDRFLGDGTLDPKVLEKHLGELRDLAESCEPVSLRQPALSATVDEDEDEDEQEDES